jgi:predicted flap endonuclease-1-like 5' DNA nuclease
MFEEWGFLLGEIWFLLLLAALIGLLAGWIIWGRRTVIEGNTNLQGDLDGCRADLKRCRTAQKDKDTKLASLQADLDACRKSAAAKPVAAAIPAAVVSTDQDFDGDGVIEGKGEGTKPATLTAARGGKADDLKRIKGVGPKLEKMLNKLGFYHFDQIANWSKDELAWVDANLEGFKGRVSRDKWVDQAKLLASGGETTFSKKVDKGNVY